MDAKRFLWNISSLDEFDHCHSHSSTSVCAGKRTQFWISILLKWTTYNNCQTNDLSWHMFALFGLCRYFRKTLWHINACADSTEFNPKKIAHHWVQFASFPSSQKSLIDKPNFLFIRVIDSFTLPRKIVNTKINSTSAQAFIHFYRTS